MAMQSELTLAILENGMEWNGTAQQTKATKKTFFVYEMLEWFVKLQFEKFLVTDFNRQIK